MNNEELLNLRLKSIVLFLIQKKNYILIIVILFLIKLNIFKYCLIVIF